MGYYTYYDLHIDNSQVKDQVEKKKQSEIEEAQQPQVAPTELKLPAPVVQPAPQSATLPPPPPPVTTTESAP